MSWYCERMLEIVFTYVDKSCWFDTMLVCKTWNKVGRAIFHPTKEDFLEACKAGKTMSVITMLQDEKIINHPEFSEFGMSAVWNVCEHGHLEILKHLLRYPGFDLKRYGYTGLVLAIQYNQIEIIRELLRNSNIDPTDYDCQALVIACRKGSCEIVELLLQSYIARKVGHGIVTYCYNIAKSHNYTNIIKLFDNTIFRPLRMTK
jgi:hypothetical protein